MNIRCRVELSQAERSKLTTLLNGGKHSVRKLKRAQILLVADEEISISVGVGGSTVYRTKRRFLVGNLEEALSEESRPGASRKLSGKEEALLVATACSNPPEGQIQTVPAAIACLMLAGFAQSLTMLAIYSLPLGLMAAGSLIAELGFAATGTL